MNTPPLGFQEYLQQTFQNAQPAPGPQPVMLGTPAPAPPPMDAQSVVPPAPPVGPPPPAMPPPSSPQPLPTQPINASPPGELERVVNRPFPLQRMGGGAVTPAHEATLIGPTQWAAVGQANRAQEEAIQRIEERNAIAAQQEYEMTTRHVAQAQAREAAAQEAIARRNEEMQARQADFDDSVKAMSSMRVDPDRFYASMSTPQRIGSLIAVGLGGFLEGWTEGRMKNRAAQSLERAVDQDIRAQEFAYQTQRDATNAKQTAFSMAMQKYNNEDAARAVAKAAALDAISAEVSQQAALYKGTDSANRADSMRVDLQKGIADQQLKFLQYIQASRSGSVWVDPQTGVTYNEAQARELAKDWRGQAFEREKIVANTTGDILKKQAEAQAKGAEKADEGAKFIADKLQVAGVPAARQAAEEAMAALNKSPGGKLEAGVRSAAPGNSANVILSDDANAREQAYWAYKNAAMKAMMGNVTDSEMARAEKQFGQAMDPESRRRAIAASLKVLERIEKNVKAGASPEAQREFEIRRRRAEGTEPAAPEGVKKGW